MSTGDNRTYEVRAPLSAEERVFQSLKDGFAFSSSFMYALVQFSLFP